MSTVQDFENAPVGATATSPEGKIAVKTGRRDLEWSVYDPYGWYHDNYRSAEMVRYTLNPMAPTTAREAFDLAWDLGHPVKEGQVIPEGTKWTKRTAGNVHEYTMSREYTVTANDTYTLRTLDPLPEPEPDWLDAPAVMAKACSWSSYETRTVFVRDGKEWLYNGSERPFHWTSLTDVTPLYPKGQNND